MGIGFNNAEYYVTGGLLLIETHRWKERTKNSKYRLDLGTKAACIKRITEATKWLDQRDTKVAP